ncbi:hypothetical protein BX600DRAFT_136927 [Xylariales sp. PMI_506]|nr:hypothetical protein BX600DRAFT_136927 [Xylariales sp. PMI_506]
MASRYSGSRYDGDARRSRSRDRSPERYNDRASQYSDGGPRRSSAESRANNSAFPAARDGFRDALPRDTPRGPRALIDAPSGPRGGGMSGDFRGRGRGRGRGWRDDSRDRGRERDIDFRDRRDSTFRDERSRERDREWRDRDRDGFRGRRPSPRGRSPPGRDFRDGRDARDGPLGVDAERARRGSRDGPLSAGSSNSDPPFGPSYRGGFNGRGRGRGRGDYDRGRRGIYDDRDRERYFGSRARSQEGRYRDRDDGDRDRRFLDSDTRSRDPREDRDVREREPRAKMERASHEPLPPARDVSPPPIAPAAPSFGSVPNRAATTSDISSVTGKAPPTGPRALKDERPPPSGPAAESRLPPTGPSKAPFAEANAPIPSGPRAQRPGPSSKQWINPSLKKAPDSPQMNRSQSFAQPRFQGFRPDSSSSDQSPEVERRPRSSDAKADSQLSDSVQSRGPHSDDMGNDDRFDRRPRSAGSSFERDYRSRVSPSLMSGQDDVHARDLDKVQLKEEAIDHDKQRMYRKPVLRVSRPRFALPRKQVQASVVDQSSESDDEDLGDIIEAQLSDAEGSLRKLEGVADPVPMDAIVRHAIISLEAANRLVTESEGLAAMIGPLPIVIKPVKEEPAKSDIQEDQKLPLAKSEAPQEAMVALEDKPAVPVVVKVPDAPKPAPEELPHPSIEHDVEMVPPDDQPAVDSKPNKTDVEDVVMEDSEVPGKSGPSLRPPSRKPNGGASPKSQRSSAYPETEPPPLKGRSKRGTSTPSPADDDDETDIEDIDLQTVETVRVHNNTPPLDSLPDFDEKAWIDDRAFVKSLDLPKTSLDNFILKRMRDQTWEEESEQQKQRKIYAGDYEAYIRFTMSDDPVAVKSREKFTYVPGAPEPPAQKPGLAETPKPESTRRSRYASERDLERVLEESRRVEDEKRERQLRAEKERYRSEKEAVIPDQYQTQEEMENDFYIDETGFIRPEKTVAAWEVLPPVDNFAEEEVARFEKAYLEFPKQWGRVADGVASRDFGTCIQFYYLKKEKTELNLKEKLKKRPRQRKTRGGRGKQRSSALVSELGNGDNENEENQETGENGERRRPRRAAAPTFNSEATPATDGESATGTSTPSRRGAGAKSGDGTEKPERKPRGRRAKEKQDKQTRANQTLAAAPASTTKGNRSRSASQVQPAEWTIQQPAQTEAPRPMQQQYEQSPGGVPVPVVTMQPPFATTRPLLSPERTVPASAAAATLPDAMGPPPLRPEPPQPIVMAPFDINQPLLMDRKSGNQPSSYWSVPEATEFPNLLKSFGSDWAAIAGHMRTKTAIMVKNYYSRQKESGKKEWGDFVTEADRKKAQGERLPPPPTHTSAVKKRYETSLSRSLPTADVVMEEAPITKLEQPPSSQPMTGRFSIPLAAQPQATVIQSPFSQPPPPPALVQAQAVSQPLAQPVSQTMSPSNRPLRAPFGYAERDRDPVLQPTGRSPLPQKAVVQAPVMSEPSSLRHPLPGSLMDPQTERQKVELKPAKEQPRHQERTSLHVKQEPDIGHPHDRIDPYAQQPQPTRLVARESMPVSRAPEPPRVVAPVSQSAFGSILQQAPPSRGGLLTDMHPSPPAPRPLSNLSRPLSDGMTNEPYGHPPPTQPTPPIAAATAPPRPAERKTSNIMSLLNDDPPAPPPPKRVSEVPVAVKTSTPPPSSALNRPPPPPPPGSHIRRESSMADPSPYGHYGRNPPPAPSSMPSLKPYTASPQPQPLNASRHLAMDSPVDRQHERDFFGRQRQYSSPHQTAANSPQSSHPYPPPNQSAQMPYQSQPSFTYGSQNNPPPAASPPPQFAGHAPAPRGHEPPAGPGRDMGWSSHAMQQQAAQQQAWAPQAPKTTQPPPTQSPWAAQHATSTPKPPPASTPVPQQPSWAAPPPRGHDPREALNLRDNRDMYQPHRSMQPPMQSPYTAASRAPEPPPPQAPAYPRYANTPGPGREPPRDPRDPGPPRSYTPGMGYDTRGAYPPPPQDMRDAQLREQQQQSILHQQLRPQDPNRGMYDRAPDRYGR